MTPKQRVQNAIEHTPTDQIPKGELCIDDALVADFLGVETVDFHSRFAFIGQLGLDLVCLPAHYEKETSGHRLPEAVKVGWEDLGLWVKQTDRFIFVLLDGGFSWGVRLMGFEKFLVAISRRTSEAMEIIGAAASLNEALIRMAAERGAGGVVIADDIAHNRGPMVHPAVLRECFFPSLKRQVEKAKAQGLTVFFHSDGDLRTLLSDLVDCGMDGLQCIESAAGMDLADVTKHHGDRLCLWGNLDPAVLTLPMEPWEIEQAVSRVYASGGTIGGFIFGTSSGLFKGMRRGNIETAYQIHPNRCESVGATGGRPSL